MVSNEMQKQEQMMRIKTEILESASRQNFAAIVSNLDEVERDVLHMLIKKNVALPVRTIRNLIVEELANSHIRDFLNLLNMRIVDDFNEDVIVRTKAEGNGPCYKLIQTQKEGFLDDAFLEGDPKAIKIIQSLISDAILKSARYKNKNIKIQRYAEKIVLWEKTLKEIGVDVPSWNAVSRAIKTLDGKDPEGDFEGLGLVNKRPVEKAKSSYVYFVSPHIWEIWEAKYLTLKERISKGQKPSKAELYWFLF